MSMVLISDSDNRPKRCWSRAPRGPRTGASLEPRSPQRVRHCRFSRQHLKKAGKPVSLKKGITRFGIQEGKRRRLLERAATFHTQIAGIHIPVNIPVEINHVGVGRVDQNRGVCCRYNPELSLVGKFQKHLQNPTLIGGTQCHLGLIQQKHRSVRKRREVLLEHRQHHLAMARHFQEFPHLRIIREKIFLDARVMLFRVEQKHLPIFRILRLQPINVVVDFSPFRA